MFNFFCVHSGARSLILILQISSSSHRLKIGAGSASLCRYHSIYTQANGFRIHRKILHGNTSPTPKTSGLAIAVNYIAFMKTILFALDFVRQWFMDSTGSPQMPSLIRTGFGEAKPVKLDAYWNKMINTNQDFVKPRSWPE